jgi:hypothetical protein
MSTTSISALLTPPPPDNRLWSSMPGWGIVADLTPPELIAERHLRVLRKWIVVGLSLVVVVCAAGFVLAVRQHSTAADDGNAVNARTAQLQQQLRSPSFRHVVQMQGTLAKVQGQVAVLMKDDVDLPALLTKVRAAAPASMAIKTLTVTMNTATTAPGATSPGLDTSGRTVIGTVVVAGSGKSLDDLPAYVDRLAKISGVVNLVPTSNLAAKGGVDFSLAFALTDKLYSHRYDASHTGGK